MMTVSAVLAIGHGLTHAEMALREAGRAGRSTRSATRAVRREHARYTAAWSALPEAERKRCGMIPWRTCPACT